MNLFGMKTNNSDDAIMNESNINLIKDKISYYNDIVSKLNGIMGRVSVSER